MVIINTIIPMAMNIKTIICTCMRMKATGSSPKREQVFWMVFKSHRSWNSSDLPASPDPLPCSVSLPSVSLPCSVRRKAPDSGGGVPDIGCKIANCQLVMMALVLNDVGIGSPHGNINVNHWKILPARLACFFMITWSVMMAWMIMISLSLMRILLEALVCLVC